MPTDNQIGGTWLAVAIPLLVFCIVQAIRHSDNSEGLEMSPRDKWIFNAIGAVIWPVVVAVWLGHKLGKGFQWTVLSLFGRVEDPKLIEEEAAAIVGDIPDTLLEKFQALENKAARENCLACRRGDCYMNTDPLYEGYKPGDPSPPELCAAHNAQGHHHVVWNGAENEILECGSERCNQLIKREG